MDIVGRQIGVDVDVIDMGQRAAVLQWEVITTGPFAGLAGRSAVRPTSYAARAGEARYDEQRTG